MNMLYFLNSSSWLKASAPGQLCRLKPLEPSPAFLSPLTHDTRHSAEPMSPTLARAFSTPSPPLGLLPERLSQLPNCLFLRWHLLCIATSTVSPEAHLRTSHPVRRPLTVPSVHGTQGPEPHAPTPFSPPATSARSVLLFSLTLL